MTATDAQVRIMMRERHKGKTQEQAAASANLRSRKTVAKYERLKRSPSELQQRRQYRTRRDPFAEHWPEVETLLADAPELEAKALFEWLCEQHPGHYQDGQVRTFQRRVNEWRALHQPQVAVLEQVHRPGEVMQTDGVWLTELRITIQGQPLAHLLIHCVLPYSNWEWGCLAQSESLMATSNCRLTLPCYPPGRERNDRGGACYASRQYKSLLVCHCRRRRDNRNGSAAETIFRPVTYPD